MWASNKFNWIVAFVAVAAACTTARGNPIGAENLPSNDLVDSVGESSRNSNSNRPLKAQQVRNMIQQDHDEHKHEVVASVLTDGDFKSSVKSQIKNFTKESVKCKAMGEFYYDPEIPDCKSCHRADCDSLELCKVECRDILNYNNMNAVLERMKETIDRLEGDINELNHILEKNNRWHVGLVFAIVIVLVISVIMHVISWKKLEEPRKFKPLQATGDIAEKTSLAPHEPDSGRGSVQTIQGDT